MPLSLGFHEEMRFLHVYLFFYASHRLMGVTFIGNNGAFSVYALSIVVNESTTPIEFIFAIGANVS
jgi:hypothetical protein